MKRLTNKQYILFCDIDGTMFRNDIGILESTKHAIRSARDQGHKVFINTGRSFGGIKHLISDIDFDGYICANGVHIIMNQKELKNVCLSEKDLLKLTSYFSENGIGFILEGSDGCYYDDKAKEIMEAALTKATPKSLERDLAGMNYHKWDGKVCSNIQKISAYAFDEAMLNEIITTFGNQFHMISYRKKKNYHKFEINSLGSDKGSGIIDVCSALNHDLKYTIGIGDSYNDIAMFQIAAISVCMGNAPLELQAKADHIARKIDEHGFYLAIVDLGMINHEHVDGFVTS